MDLLPGHIESVSDSVMLAIQSADTVPSASCREAVVQRLRAASSGLKKVKNVSEEALDNIQQREEYVDKVMQEMKNSLERIIDPDDPSSNLPHVRTPQDFSLALETNCRKLQDRADYLSTLNSKLQQDSSKEIASLTENLRIQTQSENTELVKHIDEINAKLSTVEDELRREKDYGQAIRKKQVLATGAVKVLTADLLESRTELDDHKKRLQEVRRKHIDAEATSGDQKAAQKALQTKVGAQAEQIKKSQATQGKLQRDVKTLETRVKVAEDGSSVLRQDLKATKTERSDLADANKNLTNQAAALESDVLLLSKRVQTAQAEKSKVVQDLKAVLEAVKTELRTQKEKTESTERKNTELTREKQALTKAAETQRRQHELLRKQYPTDLEDRLKQESIKHEKVLSELMQAVADKAELVNNNKGLDTEVKALQDALEEEKHLRQRRDSEHKTFLDAQLVKHQDGVDGLQQGMRELQSQLEEATKNYEAQLQEASELKTKLEDESAKHENFVACLQQDLNKQKAQLSDIEKQFEKRLHDQDTAHKSAILKVQDDEQAARSQVSQQRTELDNLREENDTVKQLMGALHNVINARNKEIGDLRTAYDASVASDSVMHDLDKFLKGCRPKYPASPTIRLQTNKEDSFTETHMTHIHVDQGKACEDVNDDESADARPLSQLPNTSRKRGAIDLEANSEATPITSKRPRLDVDLPEADHRSPVGDPELKSNNAWDESNSPEELTEPTEDVFALVNKSAIPFPIPDDASEADVDLLLQTYLSSYDFRDKQVKIRAIARGLGKLKPQDIDFAVRVLLSVLYKHAGERSRRTLARIESSTAKFLDSANPMDTSEQKKPTPAKILASEATTVHSPSVEPMELDDIIYPGTRQEAGDLMLLLRAASVKECYEMLLSKNRDRYAAADALLRKEEQEIGDDFSLSSDRAQLEDLRDDEHAKNLKRMRDKWGRSCGIPTKWRAVLTFRDATRRLGGLYNKVAALGADPAQYLWGIDGLLTKECEANTKNPLITENLQRITREFTRKHPPPESLKQQKKRQRLLEEGMFDSMIIAADGEMDDDELAAEIDNALELLQGPDDVL